MERKNQIYFSNLNVQLVWLIDPKNQIMLVYTKDSATGKIVKARDESWRDLDGGDVLPGFVMEKTDLESVMSKVTE